MTLQEAMKTNKPFYLATEPFHMYYQYFIGGTGPYKDLVSCDYFLIQDDIEIHFSTSIDLYPEQILSGDWLVLESDIEVNNADV